MAPSVPTQLQLPVVTSAPAADARAMVLLMLEPPPMVARVLSALKVTWLRLARLMRMPLGPRLKVVAHPLPPFWARKGMLLDVAYFT
jgi:hypothetical protein